MVTKDPYQLSEMSIKEPPTSVWESLKYLGPGFILSASIVGSGELIATTLVGAKAGFVLMWFLIFSCLVKVAVQIEFGKHAISSGETTMASFNVLPGPRWGRANWSIWTWLLLMLVKMLQVGGIVGGVVLAAAELFPWLADYPYRPIAAYGIALSVSILVFRGYYLLIERASLVMIGAFTVFTFASLIALQTTDMAITSSELLGGLIPSFPSETMLLVIAIGAFGITGVGGDEIMAYNYWLIEKGYASYTGPKDNSIAWERRAKGWIRIMYWDASLAMLAYTSMTVMFYLLGAAVLHRQGLVPTGPDLIHTLGEHVHAVAWALGSIVVCAGGGGGVVLDRAGRLGCLDADVLRRLWTHWPTRLSGSGLAPASDWDCGLGNSHDLGDAIFVDGQSRLDGHLGRSGDGGDFIHCGLCRHVLSLLPAGPPFIADSGLRLDAVDQCNCHLPGGSLRRLRSDLHSLSQYVVSGSVSCSGPGGCKSLPCLSSPSTEQEPGHARNIAFPNCAYFLQLATSSAVRAGRGLVFQCRMPRACRRQGQEPIRYRVVITTIIALRP